MLRNIQPTKVFKLDTGQRKLTALFKGPSDSTVSADTVKTNHGSRSDKSDITKPDILTDNDVLTHTDTVNKVSNKAIESESAKVTDSRKLQTRWEKLCHGFHMIKLRGKFIVKHVLKREKNTHLQLGAQPTKRQGTGLATSDKLLRTRLASNAGVILNFEDCLKCWHRLKKEANQNKMSSQRIHYKITSILFSVYNRLTNTYPLMAHTNLKWPINLC